MQAQPWNGAKVVVPKLARNPFLPHEHPYTIINGPLDWAQNEPQKQSVGLDDLPPGLVIEAPAQTADTETVITPSLDTPPTDCTLVLKGNYVEVRSENPQTLQWFRDRMRLEKYCSRNKVRKRKRSEYLTLYEEPTKGVLWVPRTPILFHPALAARLQLPARAPVATEPWQFTGSFTGSRAYQKPCVEWVLHQLRTLPGHGVTLNADPGAGKTAMVLWILAQLGIPTLVVVHTTKLLKQWRDIAIPKFLPGVQVDYLQGRHVPRECDICLTTFQTLMRKTHMDPVLARFQNLVVDETHHVTAKVFGSMVYKLPSVRYTIGCTATLQRSDRLDAAIEWLMGPLVYQIKAHWDADVWRINYDDHEWGEDPTQRYFKQSADYVQCLSRLADDTYRTRLLAKIIVKLVKEEHRRITVIGCRVKMLSELWQLLEKHQSGVAGLLVGSNEAEHEQMATRQVVIGTDKIIGEGYDDDSRDTMIMATPYKGLVRDKVTGQLIGGSNLIQIMGRIFRGNKKTRRNLLVDFVDKASSLFNGIFYTRTKLYRLKELTYRPPKNLTKK